MSAFDVILDQIAELRARVIADRTTLRLGTVQSSGAVLLTDGAEVTPAARLTDTTTGDIVLVGQHNRRTYVLGKPPGPPALRIHIQTGVTGTTDANGYVTVSHGAPFTPRVIQHQHTTLAASLGYNIGADTITSTTVRLRFGKWDATTILASASIGTGALVCWE